MAGYAFANPPYALSRNLRHFEPLGVAVVDPFTRLPDA